MNTLNGETFSYWLVTAGFGVLIWLLGYFDRRKLQPISVPRWLLWLCGIRGEQQVYLYRFTIQIYGLLVSAWATLVALTAPSSEQRVSLFGIGFVGLFLLAGLFVTIMSLLGRKSQHR
jgi:hypothetical protein